MLKRKVNIFNQGIVVNFITKGIESKELEKYFKKSGNFDNTMINDLANLVIKISPIDQF